MCHAKAHYGNIVKRGNINIQLVSKYHKNQSVCRATPSYVAHSTQFLSFLRGAGCVRFLDDLFFDRKCEKDILERSDGSENSFCHMVLHVLTFWAFLSRKALSCPHVRPSLKECEKRNLIKILKKCKRKTNKTCWAHYKTTEQEKAKFM